MTNAQILLVEKVAVCVCTYRRPVLLAACLASLAGLKCPPGMEVEIIVVDNELFPALNRKAARMLQGACDYPVRYVHEPVKGIARARNAALDAAMEGGADFIAFLDDDERADENWLLALMADEYRDAPVLMGWQVMVYPDPMPFWCLERNRRPEEGVDRPTAYTNNVRFSAELVRAGLRFDETLGEMGGEDNEFFSLARRRGFRIRQTARAVTWEHAHSERLTFRGQLYRSYWNGASDFRRLAIERGRGRAVLRKLPSILTAPALGLVEMLVSPLFLPIGLTLFKRRCLAGAKKIARGVGRVAAIAGHLPRPYRHTHGG